MGRKRKNPIAGPKCLAGCFLSRTRDRRLHFSDSSIPARDCSGDVGLGARLFLVDDERIEIDEVRIVLGKIAMEEPPAAVDMHQGLHASRIEIVDMLMP